MNSFLSEFEFFANHRENETAESKALRQKGLDQFNELGLPKRSWEAWQYSDFSKLESAHFRLPKENAFPSTIPESIPITSDFNKIVFVNDFFQKQMSSFPDSIIVRTIMDISAEESSEILSKLNTNENPFHALNTALMSSKILIEIPKGIILEKPIHILFQTTDISDLQMTHPRVRVKTGSNSEATIIEHYIGKCKTEYFQNIVTEFSLANNARLNHIRIQEDGINATHVSSTHYQLESDASLHGMHFASGSKLYRQDISVSLNGEGSEANLNGLCLSNEMQHLDHFVTMDHDQPQCVSRQLFKYILSDSSSGAFNGRIVVSPDSQKTDAIQTNKNLLLSESALMNSNPQLEIYANDVKCAHGSTSGQMDPEAIFYLQSRGLNKNEARLLLINGFAREVIQNIQDKATQEYLDNLLNDWLDKQKNKM